MNYSYCLLAALAIPVAVPRYASAATVVYDFETEEEREFVSHIVEADGLTANVTNAFATSGCHALHIRLPEFYSGLFEWAYVILPIPVKDWSGYDRMVMDVFCIGDSDGGEAGIHIAGPEGRVQLGLAASTKLPGRGYRQWVVPLAKWRKETSPDNISRMEFWTLASANPKGQDIFLDRMVLLKEGEPLPEAGGPCVGRDLLPLLTDGFVELRKQKTALEADYAHLSDFLRLQRESASSDVVSPDMALGWATSMDKVMPRGRIPSRPIPTEGLRLRLAGNEYESVQLLIAPIGHNLKNVRVKVEENLGDFAATNVVVSPVGYVNITNRAPYGVGTVRRAGEGSGYSRTIRAADLGWHPDPILDGVLDGVDVSGTDVQSFWVRVHCPEGQTAGEYKGALVVTADGIAPVRVPFTVRVNGFSIGRASPLPTAITFHPPQVKSRGPQAPVFMWERHRMEWVDFLADYFITMDNLYNDKGHEIPFDALERLNAQGRLGLFSIGYWTFPKSTNETDVAEWRAKTIPRLRKAYDEVKAHGLLDHAYCYGCDEVGTNRFPLVRLAVKELKEVLPGIPISTTSYDDDFGVGADASLDVVDWFTPSTAKYDAVKAAKSRKAGHRVWWYICCGPHAPYANMFVECPPIEGRVLMGAQTVRERPDGFLYYQITLWGGLKCIETGPFTEWKAQSWATYNGDGSWTCVGPDGIPLPTIRLENYRDGLEDYAYAKILEQKLKEVENGKCKVKSDGCAWISRAKAALAVPREVMETMTNYTDDPVALYRWRDEIADLIEEIK